MISSLCFLIELGNAVTDELVHQQDKGNQISAIQFDALNTKSIVVLLFPRRKERVWFS